MKKEFDKISLSQILSTNSHVDKWHAFTFKNEPVHASESFRFVKIVSLAASNIENVLKLKLSNHHLNY